MSVKTTKVSEEIVFAAGKHFFFHIIQGSFNNDLQEIEIHPHAYDYIRHVFTWNANTCFSME